LIDGRTVLVTENSASETIGLSWYDGQMTYEVVTTLTEEQMYDITRSMIEGMSQPPSPSAAATHKRQSLERMCQGCGADA
jgi:hypothetical protein